MTGTKTRGRRDGDGERERERQTERQTDTDRHRQTDRQIEGETYGQADRHTDRRGQTETGSVPVSVCPLPPLEGGGEREGAETGCGGRNFPGVSFPNRLYWPSRPDGFDMREMVDVNYGKFRVFTFAGAKARGARYVNYYLLIIIII